jgi:hypothetical protein
MDQHDAILAAQKWAAKFDMEFGECLWAWDHPSQPWWCMVFAVKEPRPEWCWFVSIGDDGLERTLIAMRRSERFMES